MLNQIRFATAREANTGAAIENLKQEVMRLHSGMKALEESNRLILEKLNRIEKKL